jgi:hypothetical protein
MAVGRIVASVLLLAFVIWADVKLAALHFYITSTTRGCMGLC